MLDETISRETMALSVVNKLIIANISLSEKQIFNSNSEIIVV